MKTDYVKWNEEGLQENEDEDEDELEAESGI